MSLGLGSALPFLKGWKYNLQEQTFGTTVIRGEKPVEKEMRLTGWFLSVAIGTTDTETLFELWTRSGRATSLYRMFAITAGSYMTGPWTIPFGSTRFLHPSKTSSAGYFEIQFYNGYLYGTSLPFFDKTVIKMSLPSSSTQEKAVAIINTPIIEITDIEAFIKSIRAVSGERNMVVDPSLIEFAEQYSSTKGGQFK
jgi:hypothetical protein